MPESQLNKSYGNWADAHHQTLVAVADLLGHGDYDTAATLLEGATQGMARIAVATRNEANKRKERANGK